jgi:hypothetical protein
MKKLIPIGVLLIALNLLLELVIPATWTFAAWITMILVAIIGLVLITKKE